MRIKIIKIYSIALAICLVYFILVMVRGEGIPCFYKSTIGLLCPGCGASNMMVALSEFKVSQAFFCNPLVFTLLAVWTVVAAVYFIKNRFGKNDKRFLTALIIFSVISTVVFTIARNLY